jgi:hypothetical protein
MLLNILHHFERIFCDPFLNTLTMREYRKRVLRSRRCPKQHHSSKAASRRICTNQCSHSRRLDPSAYILFLDADYSAFFPCSSREVQFIVQTSAISTATGIVRHEAANTTVSESNDLYLCFIALAKGFLEFYKHLLLMLPLTLCLWSCS